MPTQRFITLTRNLRLILAEPWKFDVVPRRSNIQLAKHLDRKFLKAYKNLELQKDKEAKLFNTVENNREYEYIKAELAKGGNSSWLTEHPVDPSSIESVAVSRAVLRHNNGWASVDYDVYYKLTRNFDFGEFYYSNELCETERSIWPKDAVVPKWSSVTFNSTVYEDDVMGDVIPGSQTPSQNNVVDVSMVFYRPKSGNRCLQATVGVECINKIVYLV